MTNVKLYIGDVYSSPYTVIAHGVNCKGVMGKGFALTIRERFPIVYHAYKAAVNNQGDKAYSLLGRVYHVNTIVNKTIYRIYNCFTQKDIGPNAELSAINMCMNQMLKNFSTLIDSNFTKDIVMPLIGTGIGGLKELDVINTIVSVANHYPDITLHVVTQYQPGVWKPII